MIHFVLTRFNAGNKSSEWLDHRLKFFRAFTVPSLASQTNRNFVAVFLVDIDTPSSVVSEIEEVGIAYKTDLNQRLSARDYVFREFLGDLSKKEHCVITTRLDSDDGLSRDYIDTTQKILIPTNKNKFAIYKKGVVWVDGKFFIKEETSPPFLSLVEWRSKPNNPGTVYFINTHDDAILHPHEFHKEKPMWLQACHGKNMINSPKGLGEEIPESEVKKFFDIDTSFINND